MNIKFYDYLETRFERNPRERNMELAGRIYNKFMGYKNKMLLKRINKG